MTSYSTVYDFDRAVVIDLVAADRSRSTIAVQGLDVEPGVRLRASMSPPAFVRAANAGWYGLAGESTDVDWDPDIDIDVTFHLVDALASEDWIGDGEPLLLELGGDDESAPVRSIDAWLVGEALQSLAVPGDATATVEIGVRTSHAD